MANRNAPRRVLPGVVVFLLSRSLAERKAFFNYWAKHAYGHAVRRAPLRVLSEKSRAEIAIDKTAEELFEIARRRKATGQQKHKERQRIFRLQNELKDWEMSHRIRAYLAAMRAAGADASPSRADFFAWAEKYADHLDPTTDFRIAVLDEA